MRRRPTSFLISILIPRHPRITHDPVMTIHPFHQDYHSQPLSYLLPYFIRTLLFPFHRPIFCLLLVDVGPGWIFLQPPTIAIN